MYIITQTVPLLAMHIESKKRFWVEILRIAFTIQTALSTALDTSGGRPPAQKSAPEIWKYGR